MFMTLAFLLGIASTIATQRWWRRNKRVIRNIITAPARAIKRK